MADEHCFFPFFALFYVLGLSFNLTRKTMVQKSKETAVDQMKLSQSIENKGLKAWLIWLDHKILDKIRGLSPTD